MGGLWELIALFCPTILSLQIQDYLSDIGACEASDGTVIELYVLEGFNPDSQNLFLLEGCFWGIIKSLSKWDISVQCQLGQPQSNKNYC